MKIAVFKMNEEYNDYLEIDEIRNDYFNHELKENGGKYYCTNKKYSAALNCDAVLFKYKGMYIAQAEKSINFKQGEKSVKDLKNYYEFNPEKIKTIHNFMDLEKYNLKTQDDGYILYFGRLSKEKGILNLVEAFSKLEKGVLYIAGDGPEKDNITNIINKNNLQDRIKLLGFLDSEQMKEKIRKSKFVVVPSTWYENCPYSILETMKTMD